MESVIYIDVIFFCTFAMHCLILTGAAYITGSPTPKWRILLGALLSSAMGCVFLVLRWNSWMSALILLIMAVMITFFPRSIRRFLSCLGAVLFSTFLLGGGMSAAMTVAQTQHLFEKNIVWNGKWPPWQFFLWAWAVFYILLRLVRRWLLRHTAKRKLYCQAKITRFGKRIEINGFFDTGNNLRYETEAVPVLELSACLSLFSKETGLRLIQKETFSIEEMERERFTEAAYSALGIQEGKILLFQADQLFLRWDGGEKIVKDLWIGISLYPFSEGYQLLVPSGLLEEERK